MGEKKPEPLLAAACGDAPLTRAAGYTRARATVRAANWALYWTVGFIALHAYWSLGGRLGFGDQVDPLPDLVPTSLGDWIFSVVVYAMFAAGLAVPSALARPWGRRLPRRLLVWLMWIGCLVLVARGGSGLLDDGLRLAGLDSGLTGLSNEQVLGTAHPSTYTMSSSIAIDSIFLAGGLLFGHAARLAGDPRGDPRGATLLPGRASGRADLTSGFALGDRLTRKRS